MLKKDHSANEHGQSSPLHKARNASEQAIMSSLIKLISQNKRASNYKDNRLRELGLNQLVEEDLNVVLNLYNEEN